MIWPLAKVASPNPVLETVSVQFQPVLKVVLLLTLLALEIFRSGQFSGKFTVAVALSTMALAEDALQVPSWVNVAWAVPSGLMAPSLLEIEPWVALQFTVSVSSSGAIGIVPLLLSCRKSAVTVVDPPTPTLPGFALTVRTIQGLKVVFPWVSHPA